MDEVSGIVEDAVLGEHHMEKLENLQRLLDEKSYTLKETVILVDQQKTIIGTQQTLIANLQQGNISMAELSMRELLFQKDKVKVLEASIASQQPAKSALDLSLAEAVDRLQTEVSTGQEREQKAKDEYQSQEQLWESEKEELRNRVTEMRHQYLELANENAKEGETACQRADELQSKLRDTQRAFDSYKTDYVCNIRTDGRETSADKLDRALAQAAYYVEHIDNMDKEKACVASQHEGMLTMLQSTIDEQDQGLKDLKERLQFVDTQVIQAETRSRHESQAAQRHIEELEVKLKKLDESSWTSAQFKGAKQAPMRNGMDSSSGDQLRDSSMLPSSSKLEDTEEQPPGYLLGTHVLDFELMRWLTEVPEAETREALREIMSSPVFIAEFADFIIENIAYPNPEGQTKNGTTLFPTSTNAFLCKCAYPTGDSESDNTSKFLSRFIQYTIKYREYREPWANQSTGTNRVDGKKKLLWDGLDEKCMKCLLSFGDIWPRNKEPTPSNIQTIGLAILYFRTDVVVNADQGAGVDKQNQQ